jgi:transcriptional regulator with XRE-family HTH domain
MVTQVEIARRVGLDVSSVNKILNRRAGPVFRKETIRKVFRAARELGYDFNRIKYHHRRRHPRREVALGAEFLICKGDGSVHDRGVATIRDLSVSGARVGDLQLPTGTFPAGAFSVRIRPLAKPLDEIEIHGEVVRLSGGDYGIRFGKLDGTHARRLGKFIGN